MIDSISSAVILSRLGTTYTPRDWFRADFTLTVYIILKTEGRRCKDFNLWPCQSARKDGATGRLVRARGGGFRPVVTALRLGIRDGGLSLIVRARCVR